METIVITGVTGGIGSEIAKLAAKNHYYTIGVYKNATKYKTLVDEIYKEGLGTINGVQIEYNKDMNLSELFSLVSRNNSKKIYLINTAFDINPITYIGNISLPELYNNIETNIICSTYILEQFVAFAKRNNKELSIINLDSGAGYRPIDGWALYCAAKAYNNMILQTIKVENPNIQVTQFDPGVVDTPMQENIRNVSNENFSSVDKFKMYKENNILKKPGDVALELFERIFNL